MNNQTGKPIEDIEHLKQSITDIITTPIGSRIMRRDYGSRIFELLDRPMNEGFKVSLFAATAEALDKWEPRFTLKKVDIISIHQHKIILLLIGLYESNNIELQSIINKN